MCHTRSSPAASASARPRLVLRLVLADPVMPRGIELRPEIRVVRTDVVEQPVDGCELNREPCVNATIEVGEPDRSAEVLVSPGERVLPEHPHLGVATRVYEPQLHDRLIVARLRDVRWIDPLRAVRR